MLLIVVLVSDSDIAKVLRLCSNAGTNCRGLVTWRLVYNLIPRSQDKVVMEALLRVEKQLSLFITATEVRDMVFSCTRAA